MQINFYNRTNDADHVVKTTSNYQRVDGTLKNNCSKSNPTIIISEGIRSKNYAYIPTFDRWYYITDYVILDKQRIEVHMKCDVLMSFADQIKKATAVIVRDGKKQGTVSNYLKTSNKYLLNTEIGQWRSFPVSLYAEPQYILTVSGGGGE